MEEEWETDNELLSSISFANEMLAIEKGRKNAKRSFFHTKTE
jgi:hypothetical protein